VFLVNKMRVLHGRRAALATMSAGAQIVIGQTAGMSGSVAAGVKETTPARKLVIDAVNAQGGIGGEKIEVLRMDDKFEPKLAARTPSVLIEDKKVVALFLSRGTPHTAGDHSAGSTPERRGADRAPPPGRWCCTSRCRRTCSTCAPATSARPRRR
jgi:hypothetical protein